MCDVPATATSGGGLTLFAGSRRGSAGDETVPDVLGVVDGGDVPA